MIIPLFKRLKHLRKLWLGLVLLVWLGFGYMAWQLNIQEDVSKALPQGGNLQEYQEFFRKSPIASKIVIAIGDSNSELSTDELIVIGENYVEELNPRENVLIDSLEFRFGLESSAEVFDFFFEGLPFFLANDSTLSHLDSAGISEAVNGTLSRLISPEGFAMKSYLLRDPLGLYPQVLQNLSGLQEGGDFRFVDNHLFTEDGRYLLLFVSPSFPPSESKNNGKLVENLNSASQFLLADSKAAEFHLFGGPVIAAKNGEQIRKDTKLSSILAVVLIIALLLWYYRRWMIPFLFLLPPLFGMTFALAFIYLIRGEISILTLAAGSIVLGIALDYCFHLFTHLKHTDTVEQAIKDISGSLVLSCFTTILAFLSLIFLDSQVLTDFGLLASFSLIGTLFFVLLVQPILLDWMGVLDKIKGGLHWVDRVLNQNLNWRRPVLIGIVLITVFLSFFIDRVSFEDDLNSINYFPKELQEAEAIVTASDTKEKSVFVISKADDFQDAIDANATVTAKLDSLKAAGDINSVVSLNHMFPTTDQIAKRANLWNERIISGRADIVVEDFKQNSTSAGMKEDAFQTFYDLLQGSVEGDLVYPEGFFENPLFSNFVVRSEAGTELISIVNSSAESASIVEEVLKNTDAIVVDKTLLANSLIEVVQENFNLLLLITTSLVFITLLLNYGRIELALMTFLPMVLSWVWILGICGLFNIQFNFINVLITTFIFGLGDDFCIFVSDGLLSKFKTGKNKLSSYRSSIILSTTTTIIGTGVLIFSKHPALQSIAVLSVVGMLCISFISLTLQPIIFRFAVEKRKEKKLAPLTFFIIITTIISFGYFALGCLVVTLLIPVFYILPIPKKPKRKIFSFIMSKFSGSVIYLMVNVRKQVLNPHKETFSKPSIIVANHQSFIDILAILMLNPRIVILTNQWVWNSPLYGWAVRYAGFPTVNNELEDNLIEVEKNLAQGYSIAIFPEGTRSVDGKIKRFHKGAFLLAEKYKLDIVPVLLHGFNYTIRKGDYTLMSGFLTLKVLKRISPDDISFGDGYRARAKSISAYMKKEFKAIQLSEETTQYHKDAVMANYIYKGPVLEWYVKIKLRIENNFQDFHKHTPLKGEIIDIGCGYGYLSYMLHLTSSDRKVMGLDYDDQKIEVAEHAYSKNDAVSFEVVDLEEYSPPEADAYIIKDVLHYLKEERQVFLLNQCAANLREGGTIIVRDGFMDHENHSTTKFTEVVSTKILKFNRANQQLTFLKESMLLTIAQENNLTIKRVDENKTSSNRTFVLAKSK